MDFNNLNYKQISLVTLLLVCLIFIKQILYICGVVYVFNFIKANLLFAKDRKEFINSFFAPTEES